MSRAILALAMLILVRGIAAAQGDAGPTLARLPVGAVVRFWSHVPPSSKQEALWLGLIGDSLRMRVES
jgi:hypothetical protein